MATTAGLTHRALDGRRYVLSGELDLDAPCTSAAELVVGGVRYELTAGVAALGDDMVRALGADGFDEEFGYQGGALSTVRSRPYDPQIRLREDRLTAVWRGRWHSFVIQLYGASTADLLGVLRTVRIDEQDDGVAVHPGADAEFAAPATLVKQVPGLGLLEISPVTPERVRQLPRWQGLRTPAGELFKDSLSDGGTYFVLACPDVWVTVLPLRDTVLDRVPTLVGRLRLRTAV